MHVEPWENGEVFNENVHLHLLKKRTWRLMSSPSPILPSTCTQGNLQGAFILPARLWDRERNRSNWWSQRSQRAITHWWGTSSGLELGRWSCFNTINHCITGTKWMLLSLETWGKRFWNVPKQLTRIDSRTFSYNIRADTGIGCVNCSQRLWLIYVNMEIYILNIKTKGAGNNFNLQIS